METLTTARECATRWGVTESTARRILAPLTPVDRDPATGAMRYDQAAADTARAGQPGRGSRMDLQADPVSPEEFRRLAGDESIPAAHRALWALMQSGMRVGDALSMDVRDVDLHERQAHVELPVKESGPRTFPLSEVSVTLLRQAMAGRTDGPLLVNEKGHPLSRYSASKVAREAAGVSIHAFKPPPRTAQ